VKPWLVTGQVKSGSEGLQLAQAGELAPASSASAGQVICAARPARLNLDSPRR
jgi:hypothetical protein